MSRYHLINVSNASARVGILGGSFNPPHAGHLFISKKIKSAFQLDHIIWVPTKQNPLKAANVGETFYDRIALCDKLVDNAPVDVSDIELYAKSTYTIQLLRYIKRLHPNIQLVWIMGADCVKSFHKWRKWRQILDLCEIVIYDRGDEILKIRSTKLFSYLKGINVVQSRDPKSKISYLKLRKHPLSSTYLRSIAHES